MSVPLLSAIAAYIPRDRVESIVYGGALASEGVALMADISGFTPLTEALTHGLSADQGAEELTRALAGVFTPLIAEIHAFGGSVIKFGGDALIVWYPRQPRVRRAAVIRRALTSAWRMQRAIAAHGRVPTPIGVVTLRMKIGLTYGRARRFSLGLPEYGYEDVLAGRTLDRMAEAEHHAEAGEIALDAATLACVPDAASVAEWRDGFGVVERLRRPARPRPWPAFAWPPAGQDALLDRLSRYVPQQIYAALAAGQAQVAELKPVVSLFVQFHGVDYDGDPAAGDKLQSYFATAQQVVARYGGRLNRLITGDKGSLLHIIFGAPRAVEEQEARAVRCALDLQRECGGLPFIAMQRIGITAGRVFAGPVGSPDRHDYTTMGDSINLSARLMQSAADDQILIEAAVRAPIGGEFELADLGSIMVKGKAQPIPVFAALGAREQRRQPGRAAPIIGRDGELASIERRISELDGGNGGTVLLVGEVGMGKTLMIEALRERSKRAWADGACLAYGATLSGYLFIDLLRDLLDLPPGAGPETTGQRLSDLCADLFGPGRRDATFPYLARFMGLPLEADVARRLEGLAGESLRWQLFELFRQLFRRLLERRPLVLALDDLQWADPTSLELVETLLPLTAEAPLLLLLAMRPEREARAWQLRQRVLAAGGGPSYVLEVALGPLDRDTAASLVAQYAALPEPMVEYLVEKGGGNPLFLVEMMRTLQARGLLAGATDLASVALDALDLPDSVQGLLLAQIDRLAVEARHTLQIAAVIGKSFLVRVLAALEAGEQQLVRQLAALEASEYILPEERAEQAEAYTFRHILIQESAYGTLLYERRRAYHRAVAEALERLFPAQVAEQAGLLAFHYERADDLDRAIYYHLQAADQARLLYANQEAEALYRKVLGLFDQQQAAGAPPDLDRRARTYLKIAQVRSNALDFEGAQEFYDRAFELLEQAEETRSVVHSQGVGMERTIRLAVLEHGPTTLDPGLNDVMDVSEIVSDLFEGLVELDAELNVIPAVARRWSIHEDGKRYRFELRQHLKWSDGTPLTAHDFVYAWRRNLSPQTGAGMAYQLYIVDGAEGFHQGHHSDPTSIAIKAMDDFKLEITLKAPASYFLYLLASPIAYPQPGRIIQKYQHDWNKPTRIVYNGPFRIAQWKDGEQIDLEKNSFYQGFTAGNLEKVRLYFIEPTLDHYIDGTIDWCRVDREDLSVRYPEEASLVQYLQTFFVGFSCHQPPFNHKSVRQAFAKSIDQKVLVQKVTSNVQRPGLGGVIPPGMPGHSPEIGLPFDPISARDLLRQAGYGSSNDLPPVTFAAPPGTATPRYLQECWRDHLGVNIRLIEDMPIDQIMSSLRSGSVQLALISWQVDYPDPDSIMRIIFHGDSPNNYFGWRNTEFDQLVERAATLSDQQERMALYHQADRLLIVEDTAVVPLFYRQSYGLLRPGFRIEGAGKIIRGGTFKLKQIVAS